MGTMNADGLYVKFGTELGKSLVDAGDYKSLDGQGTSTLELEINLAELTQTETILSDVVYLPKGAMINWVKTVCEVIATTGVAIDVGLIRDDRSTEHDYDGLLAAAPTANFDAVGETYTFTKAHTVPASATGTGALVGAILPTTVYKYYISASATTSSLYDAGRIRLYVNYTPSVLADNNN